MKRSIFLIAFLLLTQFLSANLLYDITDGQFRAKTLPKIQFMNDGLHYTTLYKQSAILRHNCKRSNQVDTVFNLSTIKNVDIKNISGYKFSSKEDFILVYSNVQPRYRHSFTAEYYIYNIKKKTLSPLSDYGAQEQALFSPDGKYVAFVRRNNLFIKNIELDTEEKITNDGAERSIINGHADWVYEEEFAQTRYFEWSNDSKKIAFVKFDESNTPEFSFQIFNDNNKNGNSIQLYPDELKFKYPKAGDRNSTVEVYIYDNDNKNIYPIKFDDKNSDYYIPRIRWTKSSEGELAIFKLNRNQNKLDMYFFNSETKTKKLVFTEEDSRYVDYSLIDNLYFTNDNKFFIQLSERNGFRHLYRYHINGSLDRQLSSGDWDISDFYGYDEKTRTFYYQSSETSPLQRNIYALSIKGDKKLLTSGKGTHNALFNKSFSHFFDNYSSLEEPNRISIRTNNGRELRVLEDNKELSQKFRTLNFPKKEFFSFKTSEGIELNGWILKPKTRKKEEKHPLLLVQYSGPNSQLARDQWKVDWEYYLAEKGYAVACIDGRGTASRGAEFLKCTHQQLGLLETRDQIEAAKYLGSKNDIDKERIGIWGWSFGGFMALNALSSDEQVFKVGVSVAPVTDWRLYNTAYTERYMRRPQDNKKGYDITSPLMNAEKLNGKLLIIHGSADDNVHVQNTMLYIEQLVEANKQFEMQIYTDKNHSINGKQTRRHLYTRMTEFLFKNL